MKQTAVDWLFEKMDVIGYSDIPTSVTASKEVWGQIYKKAKEMERQHIQDAYLEGDKMEGRASLDDAKKYYNETYENKTHK